MIRPATLDDVRTIAELGERFHGQAGWSDIMGYSVDDCEASLRQFIEMGVFSGFVSDNDGIDGMIGVVISPVYFCRAHKSFEELFWWTASHAPQMAGMKLLMTLMTELKAQGVQSGQMKTLAKLNDDRMPALMERLGFRASERTWIRVL